MSGRSFWSRLGRSDPVIPRKLVPLSTPIRAWREHLNLTQDEVAKRMGISQPAFAQQEIVAKPRKATREKIAMAFGITANQLEL